MEITSINMYSEIVVGKDRGGDEILIVIMQFGSIGTYNKFQNNGYIHVKKPKSRQNCHV